jgi:hypothetical protein
VLTVGDYAPWIWWPFVVLYGGAGGLAGVAWLLTHGRFDPWRPVVWSLLVANLVNALILGLACLLTWQYLHPLRITPADLPLTVLWFNLLLVAYTLLLGVSKWLQRVTSEMPAAKALSQLLGKLAALVLPDPGEEEDSAHPAEPAEGRKREPS